MENIVENNFDSLLEKAKSAPDVRALLKDREKLLRKKPFTRGGKIAQYGKALKPVSPGSTIEAKLPAIRRIVVSQDQFCAELDPYMHSVLFDENIPSICVKLADGGVQDIRFVKTAIPIQASIMEKQTLHLSALPMKFTLSDKKPTDTVQADFVTFKHYWDLRNQDGMKVKMVQTAKSYGDAGLLYYLDRNNEIRSRLISYEDGYVICSHNDENGDRMLEVVYYQDENGDECIDCWDDKNHYRFSTVEEVDWALSVEPHDFGEIPLITKRANVAWNGGQTLIEGFERLYNIFQVLQNKWGWGMLYIKGRVDTNAKKIAGNIVLNDVSYEGNGDAKFLEPPKPDNLIQTLENIFERIQIATGTTFILPKDIHTSSDTSGIAVQMTQSLDIQTAKNGIVEWQNVADKMVRLFKRGLAMELVKKGIKSNAVTEFDKMNINASFDVWQPYSEEQYNQMIATMKQAGILSQKTSVEQNTISRPDEVERIAREAEENLERELEKTKRTAQVQAEVNKLNQPKPDTSDE